MTHPFCLLPSLLLCIVFSAAGGCAPAKRARPGTVVEVIAPHVEDASVADPFAPLTDLPDPFAPLTTVPDGEPTPAVGEDSFVGETSGPARRVLETAEQMLEESVIVRGSCYEYIAAVFERAGLGDRRARQAVFQGPRRGPYADLDLLRPGDWLFIVAYPEARPIGTHSVLFIGWEDRNAAHALVVSYVGGRADRPANLLSRDVSRTYAVQRAAETSPASH